MVESLDTTRVRLVWGLDAFIAGLVVGVASAALHRYWWGLLLAVVATAVAAYAHPPGWPRIAFAFGWVAVIGTLALAPDQGGYVIAGDVQGYMLLAFAAVLLVAAMVTLPPLRRGNPATDERST